MVEYVKKKKKKKKYAIGYKIGTAWNFYNMCSGIYTIDVF